MSRPILYSFRRCPYAMRARLTLSLCLPNHALQLREVVLKNKPEAMLAASPKGTVPVLVLENGDVIDESLDIMHYALRISGQESGLYIEEKQAEIDELIQENDGDFKWALDRYKYADRYEESEQFYREHGEAFLNKLEARLNDHAYLMGENATLADLAIFPFVRQFAHVNKQWFDNSEYQVLNQWLDNWLESELFLSIMKKYEPWQEGDSEIYFPAVSPSNLPAM